ncbi:PRC-barrel domain-containing protein [Phormidium sp. CCY1219]|uniref:PRC-barrel domain-containing protein n=1 Tax=Phormidium sp. CCY1219 TaxID=2886104 RepID=UPI002D1EC1CC|nr:PRC-barrel domain-containing protein [Phormidium sp. CCY1219]MEB3830919.1 PRC-barrel domain-containing protein [Phormidium sp. CCY1219]
MSTEQQVSKRSDLLDRRVINRATADEIGKLDELWLDPQSHKVVGFSCKAGFLGMKKNFFSWNQIHTIGQDSVLINFDAEASAEEKPEGVMNAIGHEVLTDTGTTAGQLVDYMIATQTGTVVSYLFKSSGWRGAVGGTYLLSPEDISSFGSKRLIVVESAVQEPQQYTEGMNQRLNKVGELLQNDYDKTMKDLRGLIKGAQDVSEQAQNRLQDVSGQAREDALNFADRARDKAQEVAEQTRDRVAQMKDQEQQEASTHIGQTSPESPPTPEPTPESQENQQ